MTPPDAGMLIMVKHVLRCMLIWLILVPLSAATVPNWLPPTPHDYVALGGWLTPDQGKRALAELVQRLPDQQAWDNEANHLRRRIQQAAGLYPWPKRTPLNLVIRGRNLFDGYGVVNIAFEPIPGYHATANLYWPSEPSERLPLVLSCHGHAGDHTLGRRSETQQRRCGILAKAGAMVLALDMVGYGESLAHLPFDKTHPTPFSLTLQTWTSIRALDLLCSLDRADPTRIAVTGESGGGTQTFLLAALDSRVSVSVPVVMVSAHFFGGCPCESGLPIHISADHFTTNAGIAALAAPRSQLLISNGKDWTAHTPQVEFPFLRHIYGLYKAEDQIANVHLAQEGHDYGPSKRQALYSFVAPRLGLDLTALRGPDGRIDESHAHVAPRDVLAVFSPSSPDPLQPTLAELATTMQKLVTDAKTSPAP